MRKIIFHRGQNIVDLAIILGVVGMVFIGMQTYIKRSIQGKIKNMTDHILSSDQAVEEEAQGQESNLTVDSQMTAIGDKGGKKSLNGYEHSFYEYIKK